MCSDCATQLTRCPLKCEEYVKFDFSTELQKELDDKLFKCEHCDREFHPNEYIDHREEWNIKHGVFPEVILNTKVHNWLLTKTQYSFDSVCCGEIFFKNGWSGNGWIKGIRVSISSPMPTNVKEFGWECRAWEFILWEKWVKKSYSEDFSKDDINVEFQDFSSVVVEEVDQPNNEDVHELENFDEDDDDVHEPENIAEVDNDVPRSENIAEDDDHIPEPENIAGDHNANNTAKKETTVFKHISYDQYLVKIKSDEMDLFGVTDWVFKGKKLTCEI